MASYGAIAGGNTRDDFLNSKLIILWGWNPSVTIAFGMTSFYLALAREAGVRIVAIDPQYTDTGAVLASEWIPIRPNTDAAMMAAMAYVIITENLCDEAFLTRLTIGFEKFRDYVLGAEDGQPKTPSWASRICGVPAPVIASLARDYARARPAALMDGIAPGRTAYGEQYHRIAVALAAMTGNIGVPGGNAPGYGAMGGVLPPVSFGPPVSSRMKGGPNPLDAASAPRPLEKFNSMGSGSARVNRFHLADAILRGRRGGYPADYKALYMVTLNYANQCSNTNKILRALKKLEFIVVHEQFMTPTRNLLT